jgi:anti-sigma factor RsiW
MISRLFERYRYMREHRWTHAHLSEYLDGDLDRAEKRRVEDHASICPQCRRLLATLRRTLAELRHLRPRPRDGIADGVIDGLRERG